LRWRKKRGFF